MSVSLAIPAAQYLRMSTEDQQYSIANQSTTIQEYAQGHGFIITKTYEDPGKSGVIIRHRKGLSTLLKDVLSGDAKFRAILVYDVSRWGRFQNPDEAAHYEFFCASAGIPLHYCAEQFSNDGTALSSLFKAWKWSMAAEFSRELGEKVFRGKTRLAQMGFWMGGPPGYGWDVIYACVAAFALKMPLKLSRYCRKTRIHNTQATSAGAMVPGDIVR
jgi:DNA invertase Pin-like site-specific DNA recombinase